MLTHTNGVLASAPGYDDVVVVRWPEQRAEAERLARLHRPHLLLVEPDAAPPNLGGCITDWIRLPADDADVRARLTALVARDPTPGRTRPRRIRRTLVSGRRVYLSPTDERIAEVAGRVVRPRRSGRGAVRTDLGGSRRHEQGTCPHLAAAQTHPTARAGDRLDPRLRLPAPRRARTAQDRHDAE